MELEQHGMRLSLVLGNDSVLKSAALALTATLLSSLLELFSQVAVLKGDAIEKGYEVVDAVEGNGNNDDDGGEEEEGGADDAEGKETKKGPVNDPDITGEAGDDDEPEGDDDNDDDDDDDNHENDDDDNHENDDDDEEEDEDEDEDGGEEDDYEGAEEEEEDEDEEALQPPKKRKK